METQIVEIKNSSGLPLDELVLSLRKRGLTMSRAQVSRVLAKHQLTTHTRPKIKQKPKKFKEYPPGFYHMDTTYLPKIDGQQWKAIVAIERKTRWNYVEVVPRKTAANVEAFMQHLLAKAPIKPHTILTDNGTEFTSRLLARRPKKPHKLDALCAQNQIKHKCTKVKHPWTNGLVERQNRRLKDATVYRTHYASIAEMTTNLLSFAASYNLKPHRRLGNLSPIQAVSAMYQSGEI